MTRSQAGFRRHFSSNALLFLLTLFVSLGATAANDVLSLVPRKMRSLPVAIQEWFVYETDFLSRKVDSSRISSPEQNEQDPRYAPESKTVFNLVGYWVPADDFDFHETKLPASLRERLVRTRNGRTEFLFFVHPESVDLYPEIVNGKYQKEKYRAIATASSRSLLVWKDGFENQPFIAKVSLNKRIGHINRTILSSETSYSVGVTQMLNASTALPESVLFMDEVISASPVGVGTALTSRPLLRSVRALLMHTAPTSGDDAKTL